MRFTIEKSRQNHARVSLRLVIVAVVATLLATVPSSMYSQATVGIQPLGSYSVGQVDAINVADLGIHVAIPLYSHKARGSSQGLRVMLRYETSAVATPNDNLWNLSVSTAAGGYLEIDDISSGDCSGLGSDGNYHVGNYDEYTYTFVDDTGFGHPFSGYSTIANNCAAGWSTTSLNETAADGSGYLLSATGTQATAKDLSGNVYTSSFPSPITIVDANGNKGNAYTDFNFHAGYPSGGYTGTFTDDSNVSATLSGGTYNLDQYGQPVSRNPTLVKYKDTSGNTQTVTINYRFYSTQNLKAGLVDSVVFPDGSAYHFTYQASLLLGSVVLPAGGAITYQSSAASLTRTTDDGSTQYSTAVTGRTSNGIPNQTMTTVLNADGSTETINFVRSLVYLQGNPYGDWRSLETAHVWKTASGVTIKSTMRCYNGSSGTCTTTPVSLPVSQISTTTTQSSGLSSKVVEYRDANGLTIETDEYDYSVSSPKRRNVISYAVLGNNILDHPHTITTYDISNNILSQKTFSYDDYVPDSSGVSGLVAISGSRGNMTSLQERVSSSQSVSSHTHYDDAGQVVSTVDGRNNTTSFLHDSTDTYVTRKTYPQLPAGTFYETSTPDPNTGLVTQSQDVNGNVTAYTYDSMLRVVGICHPDHGYSRTSYSSPTTTSQMILEGTGSGCTPGGGVPSGSWLTTTYQADGYGRILHVTDPAGYIADTQYDQMGRVYSQTNSHQTTGGLSTDGTITYLYDALGRKTKQTNQDGSIEYWCYDGLATNGQPNCHAHQGTSAGEWVDYRDASLNEWQRTTDGLGRLINVFEPNGSSQTASMETDYDYDALDNLAGVAQWGGTNGTPGGRFRGFTYDNLSRLIQSASPESGYTCYGTTGGVKPSGTNCTAGYDAAGNLQYKTDARGVTIQYSYDAWNRLIQKSYSDGTPTANYAYDGYDVTGVAITPALPNAKGRLSQSAVASANVLSSFAYDPMGRLIGKSGCIPGDCSGKVSIAASYYLDGNMHTLSNGWTSHPISWTYQYDGAARLINITASTSIDSITKLLDATSANSYGPEGLENATFGYNTASGQSLVRFQRKADSRLRPIFGGYFNSAGSTIYSYCMPGSGNSNCSATGSAYTSNGNLAKLVDSVTGTWSYGYDTLNRLSSGSATSGANSGKVACWTYDPFGNRTSESLSTTACNNNPPLTSWAAFNESNSNRMDRTSWNSVQSNYFDDEGNETFDGVTSYRYDGEGRICAIINSISGTSTGYLYDAEGNRVGKGSLSSFSCNKATNGFTTTAGMIVGFEGQQLTEITGSGSWDHSNLRAYGQLLATYKGSHLYFSLNDWLGTRRAEVSSSCATTTYSNLPFGNALITAGGCPYTTEQHFTGKERDSDSGNDYFGARYYTSVMGRFMSPDDGSDQNPLSPQSWNLYSYGHNNPLIGTDDDGHTYNVCPPGAPSGSAQCTNIEDTVFEAEEKLDRANGVKYNKGTISDNGVVQGTFTHDPDIAGDPSANIAAFGNIGNQGMGAIYWFGQQMVINAASDGLLGVGLEALQGSRLATQIGRNALKGSAGEATVNAMLRLRGYRIVGGQVTVKTTKGIRYVDYIVEKGGEHIAIEVKTGDAVRNTSQLTKDGLIESQGGLIGNNGGILQGQTLKLKTIEMRPF